MNSNEEPARSTKCWALRLMKRELQIFSVLIAFLGSLSLKETVIVI